MDGYAVRAQDTFGATPSLPTYLRVAGEISMGSAPAKRLEPVHAMLIHTGGMLPENADAVVMVENTQPSIRDEIEIFKAAAVGENVLKVGEDVAQNGEVMQPGLRLRPQDLGALVALGITQIEVTRAPRVALIATGDEVLPPQATISPGQVRDINSYTLSGLVESVGGVPVRYGIIADDHHSLKAAAESALRKCDVLTISAGSSTSVRDITERVLHSLGEPGVLLHGIAMKPGKPTILAVSNGKPALGLPGNPVSAMVVARILLLPILHFLQGTHPPTANIVAAQLTRNITSTSGREDHIPVRLLSNEGKTYAEPIFGKSNLIFTLVRSDGSVTVPLNSNGLSQGETVNVLLY
jgi:molybdopterin molybdotransferase